MKKYTVYVIKSSEGFMYTGMTEDIEKRIINYDMNYQNVLKDRGLYWGA